MGTGRQDSTRHLDSLKARVRLDGDADRARGCRDEHLARDGELFPSVPPPAAAFDHDPRGSDSPTSTFCDRLAAFLTSQPNQWVDGRAIASVAGYYAWRSRISDLRRPPYNLNIENRQYRQGRHTISEYRLVVPRRHGEDLGRAA